MKLSKAQETVLIEAKEEIDFARNHTFYEWVIKHFSNWFNESATPEEIEKKFIYFEEMGYKCTKERELEKYEMNRSGIDYLCHASSATIRKLENLGLIEIIHDSCGVKYYGFDVIKILNY